jgi:DNA-binding NarL/FixJ family response regulator
MASEAYPGVALLLLTRYPDLRTAQVRPEDLPTNCGFLSKDSVVDAGVLLAAVEAVLQDGQPRGSEPGGRANPLASLTPVQLRVLRLVAQGYTSTEIARRRDCSVSAVEKVLRGIYQRLGITTDGVIHPRVEAIRIYAATAVIPERPDGQ